MKPFIIFLALFVLIGRTTAQEILPVQEGLFIAEFTLPGEFEAWYSEHYCDAAEPDSTWILAPVYSAPNLNAERRGVVWAATRWRKQPGAPSYLDSALEFHAAGNFDTVEWNSAVGDWGYGITFFSPRTSGSWALLPTGVFGRDAWIRVEYDQSGSAFSGSVGSAVGRLVTLSGIGSDDAGMISDGKYYVLDFDSTTVSFRPELPSDMDCGEDVAPDPPAQEIPTFQIPIALLFPDSKPPLLSITYGKGC
jgi:hypothetical protein